MIRIPALDMSLEQDTLNRIAETWIPKGGALRALELEIDPGVIRLQIDGRLPLVRDQKMTADLSVELRGNELWLRLERTSVPLIPKAAVVGLVASQANQEALRAEGSSLVLDLAKLFVKYEIETKVHAVSVEQGGVRLIFLMDPA